MFLNVNRKDDFCDIGDKPFNFNTHVNRINTICNTNDTIDTSPETDDIVSVCDWVEPLTEAIEITPSLEHSEDTEPEFNNKNIKLDFDNKGLNIINLNIRHLKPKLDDVKILLQRSNKIDILGLCETFLHDDIPDSILSVDGYKFERRDRNICTTENDKQKGGGVLIYIAEHLDYKRKQNLESDNIESIWIEISLKHTKPILINSIYRPPSAPKQWLEMFSDNLENITTADNEVYIMGDINVDISRQETSNKSLRHILELHDLTQMVEVPTRITSHSETLIDHIYASHPHHVYNVSVPVFALSDHYPVCFTRKAGCNIKRNMHSYINYRCFKHFDNNSFCTDFINKINEIEFCQTDTNFNFDKWHEIFIETLNKHAKIKTKRIKRKSQPDWYTDEIREAQNKRDYHHKKRNWTLYKQWRNQTKTLIRKHKKNLFSESIAQNKDGSYLWKHINDINNQKKRNTLPSTLKVDPNTPIESKNEIADALNTFFINISDKLKQDSGRPYTEMIYETNSCDKLTNMVENKVPSNTQFNIPLMNINEIKEIISKLDPCKATGIEGVSPRVLKNAAGAIIPSLLQIINISISTGHFPDILKYAKVFPIHKGGDESNPSNYRPISVLPLISKIIEKHVAKHLFRYLNKYNLLHTSQSGFRRGHSCQTALVKLVDDWLNHIDKGDIVGAIFFDLKKAFDVVNHNILLKKLAAYKINISSLNWFTSYLNNRKQCIVSDNIHSATEYITSGVPQGSVLGPILFILFINDLPLYIENANTDMFADDTTVHAANKRLENLNIDLQESAYSFDKWCKLNNMYINANKTSTMILGSKYKTNTSDAIHISIENDMLASTEHQKLLGIYLDQNLTYDKEVDEICKSVSKRITLLKLLSKYVDQNSLKIYYQSYILPLFDYGCMVWGKTKKSNIDRLIKLQKRAARIILKADIMTSSKHMFTVLNWLPFDKRVDYHTCIMVYKALNKQTPEYISQLLVKTSDTHSLNLRSNSNDDLRIPRSYTQYFDKSFSVCGPKLWNNLPADVKLSKTLEIFKRKLKDYMLNM